MREQQIKREGDSEGMHEGATDGVRGWEGDSEGMHEGATNQVRG